MNKFDKIDDELKDLWGDFPTSDAGKHVGIAMEELSKLKGPSNLSRSLKNISDTERSFSIFALKPLAAMCFICALLSAIVVFKNLPAHIEYINLNSESSIEDTLSLTEEDEDIFDDTLNNMEEIIWSA